MDGWNGGGNSGFAGEPIKEPVLNRRVSVMARARGVQAECGQGGAHGAGLPRAAVVPVPDGREGRGPRGLRRKRFAATGLGSSTGNGTSRVDP